MRKLVVGIVFVAACGGGDDGAGPSDAPVRIDTATPADAPPTIDARQVDAPPVGGPCNILTQSGCAAGQKCTWIRASVSPPLGQVGCAPAGTVATNAACSYGPTG